MSADRFRLAILVLIVVVLAAAAWAFQWRYVVVTAGDFGTLMRFNRFTAVGQLYVCTDPGSGVEVGTARIYVRSEFRCGWIRR